MKPYLIVFIFVCILNFINAENALNLIKPEIVWEAETYPNPFMDEGYIKCNGENMTHLCDPDKIFSKEVHKNLMEELTFPQGTTIIDRTQNCDGLIGGVAIANRFHGGNSRTLKKHANELLRIWNMDKFCQKSFLILIAIKDRSLWIAKDSNVPIHSDYFTLLFESQKQHFRAGNYEKALINIIRAILNRDVMLDERKTSPNETENKYLGILRIFLYIIFPSALVVCIFCCIKKYCCSSSRGGYGGYSGRGGGDYIGSNYISTSYYSGGYSSSGGGGHSSSGGGDGGGGGGGDW